MRRGTFVGGLIVASVWTSVAAFAQSETKDDASMSRSDPKPDGGLAPVTAAGAASASASASASAAASASASASAPLDKREPPFTEFDYAWMNGSNAQPSSLLSMGPLTWSLYVDTYFAWQDHAPSDHTIFPTTTAPRFNEISLNLAHLGVDVTGLDGPIGRLYIQYGSTVETVAGQDTTTNRGFFLTNRLLQNIEQAGAGWHFHWLHGVNVEAGIFPSYIGLESYLPEENWTYTHALVSDATPYYFFGVRGQIFTSQRLKIELWVVNGWQTFGQWHEAKAGGYLWNWRPNGWLSLVNSVYAGQEAPGDPHSARVYSDNAVQVKWFAREGEGFLKSMAIAIVGDVGYEERSDPAPSGWMGGASIAHRWEWTSEWKTTIRGDLFYDETQAISPKLPVGSPYVLPGQVPPVKSLFAGGVTGTLDYWPSPWLLTRLEYSHRNANQLLFSGPGGITGPNGQLPTAGAVSTFVPDLRKEDDRLLFNVTLRL